MAMAVVDFLQSVEVEQKKRKTPSRASRTLRLRVEHVEQAAVVGQTRERVTGHQMPDLLFHPFALSDVEGGSQPGGMAVKFNAADGDIQPACLAPSGQDLDLVAGRRLVPSEALHRLFDDEL